MQNTSELLEITSYYPGPDSEFQTDILISAVYVCMCVYNYVTLICVFACAFKA